MNVEITFDPTAEMAGSGLEMDRARHEVQPDGDWILWVRRTFGMPHLFTYYHREARTMVLAAWLQKPRFAMELDSWDPETEARPSPASLRARLRNADEVRRENYNHMRSRAARKRLDLEEKATQRADLARWARHSGNENTAARLESGAPFLTAKEGGDEMAEFTGDLVSKAKGRIVTGG